MFTRERKVVLVTGGSGLVGTSIAEEVNKSVELILKYDFVFLSSKDADLVKLDDARLVFEKYKPSYVINLAAKVGGLYANMKDNDAFYDSNMRINENVLQLAHGCRVNKCISCLSTCIFPDNIELPLDESKIHSGPPHESNRGYSLAKRNVDKLNRYYNAKSSGSSVFTAVIPTNIYGKFDNFNLDEAHVIPGLIHRTYLAVKRAKSENLNVTTLVVCGSGQPLRQFVYAPDLAQIMIWCLQYYKDDEPIIVCPDEIEELSIRDVAGKICDIFSRKFAIKIQTQFNPAHADGQYRKTATNGKFRKLNQEFRFTPIDSGLEVVIDWFCETYPNLRKGSRL